MADEKTNCSFKTCNNIPENGRKICRRCLDRAARKRKERIAKGLCSNCNKPAVIGLKRCGPCGAWRQEYQKARKSSLQAHYRYQNIVYDYYGRQCVCCGEKNEMFLTLDHINGREGTSDKKKTGYTMLAGIVRAIIKGSPRTDIRLLCYNCNCGRERNKGICPHKEIK